MSKIKVNWISCGTDGFRYDYENFSEKARQEVIAMVKAEGYPVKPDAAAEFEFDFGADFDDYMICEYIFHQTNDYRGSVWAEIEKVMPAERSHTAISTGDVIEIDGRSYRCMPFGFKPIEEGE